LKARVESEARRFGKLRDEVVKVTPIESNPYAKWPNSAFKIESDYGEIEGSYDLSMTYVQVAKLFKEIYGGTPVPHRLHRRAVELLGNQFGQKIREALLELPFEVFYQVILEETEGKPTKKTRDSILHMADAIKKRRLNLRRQGRRQGFTLDDLSAVIKKKGAGLTLTTAAQLLNVNPRTLSRNYKKKLGVSTWDEAKQICLRGGDNI